MKELATGLQFPEGPIALPDGSVLLVEIKRGTLTRIGADGRQSVVAKTGGGPNGAALGPDGKVYVCNNGGFEWHEVGPFLLPGNQPKDYAGGSIQRVDLATGAVETLFKSCGANPLRGPNDLVFDSTGGFWFTDHGKTRERDRDRGGLYYARPDGKTIREVVYPLDSPNGVGLSPDGSRVYAAETHTGRVFYWNLAGSRRDRAARVAEPGTPAGRAARPAAPRLAGDRRGGERLRRDDRERRHHDHLARRREGRARAHAGSAHDEHLLRREGPEDGVHHAVGDRQARLGAVEDGGAERSRVCARAFL